MLSDRRGIRYSCPAKPQLEPYRVVISVARLIIDHDSAAVTLGISSEGVVGRFWLGRTTAHCWRVVKAEIYEI